MRRASLGASAIRTYELRDTVIVTFTVHQRPFYLRPVLETWRRVRWVMDAQMVFHVDPSSQQDVQLGIIEEFATWHQNVVVCVHSERLGVLGNPFHAMSEAFENAEVVALAEEDVEVASDILEYYEEALRYTNIACAWSDRDGKSDQLELRSWFNPWGWVTTREMWESVLKPTWDLDYSSATDEGPGGWDCNIGLRVLPDRGLKAAFPMRSRTKNIGKHAGVHAHPEAHGEYQEPKSFDPNPIPQTWRLVG